MREEEHPRFDQPRREERSGADTDLPIRDDVVYAIRARTRAHIYDAQIARSRQHRMRDRKLENAHGSGDLAQVNDQLVRQIRRRSVRHDFEPLLTQSDHVRPTETVNVAGPRVFRGSRRDARRVFHLEAFIDACHEARRQAEPRRAVREEVARALAEPGELAEALRPTDGRVTLLHRRPDLTILHVVRPAQQRLHPHDHALWAVIGLYAGREEHTLYRRSSVQHRTITVAGGRRLVPGDVLVLGDDAIHAVANPGDGVAGAIHVYGGDLLDACRRQWWPGPFEERPYDFETARRQFTAAGVTGRC